MMRQCLILRYFPPRSVSQMFAIIRTKCCIYPSTLLRLLSLRAFLSWQNYYCKSKKQREAPLFIIWKNWRLNDRLWSITVALVAMLHKLLSPHTSMRLHSTHSERPDFLHLAKCLTHQLVSRRGWMRQTQRVRWRGEIGLLFSFSQVYDSLSSCSMSLWR